MFSQVKKGFTLIDLLVAVSIFAILTSLTIANFIAGRRKDALRQSGVMVTSLLQEAQSAALAGMSINGSVPVGGYGIHFDKTYPTQVIYFADIDGDEIYNPLVDTIVSGVPDNLPDRVIISDILIGNDSHAKADFVFKAPDGNRYINGILNSGKLTINLLHEQTEQSVSVSATTSSGQITTN